MSCLSRIVRSRLLALVQSVILVTSIVAPTAVAAEEDAQGHEEASVATPPSLSR